MSKNGLKYMSVYEQIKVNILSGKHPAGSFLPTEKELIASFGVSCTTVRRAISILVEEGFLNVQQGRGMEVLPLKKYEKPGGLDKFRNVSRIAGRFLTNGPSEISVQGAVIDVVEAPPDVARAFGLSKDKIVYRLQRIQYVDGQPFSYMIDYLHRERVPDLEHFSNQISNLHEFLLKQYGITPIVAEETISAVNAGFIEAQLLNVSAGSALLLFRRASSCEHGPLKYSVTTVRSDLFQLVINMEKESSSLPYATYFPASKSGQDIK